MVHPLLTRFPDQLLKFKVFVKIQNVETCISVTGQVNHSVRDQLIETRVDVCIDLEVVSNDFASATLFSIDRK